MTGQTAIVKYEADKWGLARYRAEKRFLGLKTIEDRIQYIPIVKCPLKRFL